jgi:signal transduction histidine kinase
MERQVRQLARLVDDLLEVSRIARGELELRRERVELAAIVRNALETSEPLIREAGHQLIVAPSAEPLWLDGDPLRLAQVLSNLLNNAAKYTAPGGRIEVRARRAGEMAEVSVRDNGAGIPAEMLDGIFEMFNRGERTHADGKEGLGIGLALAQRLARMHGGSITAASEGANRGSEFTLRLPLAAAGETLEIRTADLPAADRTTR